MVNWSSTEMLRQFIWEILVFARNDIKTLVVVFLDFQDCLIYSGSFVFPKSAEIKYCVEAIDKFWENWYSTTQSNWTHSIIVPGELLRPDGFIYIESWPCGSGSFQKLSSNSKLPLPRQKNPASLQNPLISWFFWVYSWSFWELAHLLHTFKCGQLGTSNHIN